MGVGSAQKTAYPFTSLLFSSQKQWILQAAVTVITGLFFSVLLKGFAIEKTAAFASAVAAMNSQQLGGRSGIPKLDEVIKFLAGYGITLE